jgi:2-polyprenyl-6-methoxyphenol hydroxylase-like FAD-dependent oxidoreductase
VIERELTAACKAAGVELVRGAQTETVAVSDEAVEVTTSAGERWSADYVVGADGAHSVVRREIGIPLEGSRSENAFVVVDAEMNPSSPQCSRPVRLGVSDISARGESRCASALPAEPAPVEPGLVVTGSRRTPGRP